MASGIMSEAVCRRLAQPLTPRRYRQVADLALAALFLIVLTGAAVRLTGSGLGCPDWPKCYGRAFAPLETHAVIEYGNRILSGLVGFATIAAGVLAWRRRPFRRDLAVLGALLPLGVVSQAVLGGFTVRQHLAPGFVMSHYALSMLVLVAAVALAWRARHEPGGRPRGTDIAAVWAVRGLVPIGAITIFAGTAATAAGPHAGGKPGQRINRLDFEGSGTLDWVIHRHGGLAAFLGIATVALWLFLRRRGVDSRVRGAVTLLAVLLAVQGVVGSAQYAMKLPAEIVWVHVGLAALTWVTILWATAAAGRLAPRPAAAQAPEELERLTQLEPAA